jgi:toxin ParE1/3/4
VTYVFHPEAAAEHLEAIAYYEGHRPGLGAAFVAEFERAVTEITQTPSRYPMERKPDIRRAQLRRFPFAVLYREAGGNVQILAVAHHRRRPAYWLGRL